MDQNKYRTFIFCSLVTTFWLENHFCLQILPGYVQHLGGSLSMVGLVSGAFGVTQMILRIPAGVWSDRIGRRKPFILAAFLTGVVANLMFLAAKTPMALVWARGMSGVSTTMWVIISVFLADMFPADQLTRTVGLLNSLTHAATLAASTSGAYAAQLWGWRAPFIAGLAASFLGLISLLVMAKEQVKPVRRPFWPELISVFRQRLVLLASFLGILLQYGVWTSNSFTPVVAARLGASKGDLGLLSFFSLVPCALTSALLGRLKKKLGERLMVLSAFGLLTFGLITIPFAGSYPVLCLFLTILSLGRGVVFAVFMGWTIQDVSPERKGTAMGIFQSIYAAGMFLGPAISGALADKYGLSTSFFVSAVLMIGAAIITGLAVPMRRDRIGAVPVAP